MISVWAQLVRDWLHDMLVKKLGKTGVKLYVDVSRRNGVVTPWATYVKFG